VARNKNFLHDMIGFGRAILAEHPELKGAGFSPGLVSYFYRVLGFYERVWLKYSTWRTKSLKRGRSSILSGTKF
jgi:hypothetical protein